MNLLHIFTPRWMRTRRLDELQALRDKLDLERDAVVCDIHLFSDRAVLRPQAQNALDRLYDTRVQLGQLIEDLDRVIGEKVCDRRAA